MQILISNCPSESTLLLCNSIGQEFFFTSTFFQHLVSGYVTRAAGDDPTDIQKMIKTPYKIARAQKFTRLV